MKKIAHILILILLFGCNKNSKPIEETKDEISGITEINIQDIPKLDTTKVVENERYNSAFYEMNQMLENKTPMNFKRAIFLIEWAYLDGQLDYDKFQNQISAIARDLQDFIQEKGVSRYKTAGNYALFEFFTKPNKMNNNQPYTYGFNDFYGREDYQNIFVSKLLKTHQGQCRSMPILYKLLSEEIGAESYLALGPNHMYIKHLDEQGKWVNVELTNGNFSTDSWMISSMDISAESIRKGVYMKELSMKESIAFCLVELALAHKKQHGFTEFGLLCSDKALKYYPSCMPALMHKANTLRKFGLDLLEESGNKETLQVLANYKEYKAVEKQIDDLGFRQMSEDKYQSWVKSMEEERQKRVNNISQAK